MIAEGRGTEATRPARAETESGGVESAELLVEP